jgi:hypothetical protein
LTGRQRFPFTNELRAMANDSDDRDTLVQLANDPDIEQIWTGLEKVCGAQENLIMRVFIREVLVLKRLAGAADDWPDFVPYAKKAESLAAFLKGSGQLPPPLPMPGICGTVVLLETIASKLRERAQLSRIRASRQDIDGSRPHTLFMALMSLSMQDLFGRPLDNEVAQLTNILFPLRMATQETVRSARRPMTRRGRKTKRTSAT